MSDLYMGQILFAGFNFAMSNTATCQGQILAISQNTALFSLIGTTFGGNGQSTFQLPHAGGRAILGQGQAPGVTSSYAMGQVSGSENITLNTSQMPAHVHTVNSPVTLEAKGSVGAAAQLDAPEAGAFLGTVADGGGTGTPVLYVPASAGGTAVNLAGASLSANTTIAGANLPFSIMQPYLVVNALIVLQGIYPSRN